MLHIVRCGLCPVEGMSILSHVAGFAIAGKEGCRVDDGDVRMGVFFEHGVRKLL